MPHQFISAQDSKSARIHMPGNDNVGLTHVVRPNDSLTIIANQYNIPYQELAKWNSILPPYAIVVGQTLVLNPPQQLPANESKSTIQSSIITPVTLGASTPKLFQNDCEVSVVRIKTFQHNSSSSANNFCGWMSACIGASYIIKNDSTQARVVDILYASNEEERVLYRDLKIEGQSLHTGIIYNVDRKRDSWNILVADCFW
jgi:LysM repeat protein